MVRMADCTGDQRVAERNCLVTHRNLPNSQLVRFVLDPNNEVVADLKNKLPGQGVWITASQSIVCEAVTKDLLKQYFGDKTITSKDLPHIVATLLTADSLRTLSLAKKAGQIISGFDKVKKALQNRGVMALIHASDASDNGLKKIAGSSLAAQTTGGADIFTIARFSRSELSLALGQSNVVHAALLPSEIGHKLISAVTKLDRYLQKNDSTPSVGAENG